MDLIVYYLVLSVFTRSGHQEAVSHMCVAKMVLLFLLWLIIRSFALLLKWSQRLFSDIIYTLREGLHTDTKAIASLNMFES